MKKVLAKIILILAGAAAGAGVVGLTLSKKINKIQMGRAKVHALYMAFDQWLRIRQEGKTLIDYFKSQGYKTIAVYGMKELGEHLCDELFGSDITVKYAIDQNADQIYAAVDVVTPDDELEPVDAIVVTAIYYFDEIEEALGGKVDCPIVSLEDILYGI